MLVCFKFFLTQRVNSTYVKLRPDLKSDLSEVTTSSMNTLSVPQGDYQLTRFPIRAKEQLRAWDAADEYLLQQLSDADIKVAPEKLLILNDQFGAVTVALHQCQPLLISDSYLAHAGTLENAKANDIDPEQLTLRDSLDYPDRQFDLILLKIPKSLAMLEDQLIRLRPCLHKHTRLIAGGMVKAIHTSTLKLFEKYIGPTTTSLARKKARLIFPQIDKNITSQPNPYPSRYVLENTQLTIVNHAGVFSRESLDIGTRFFLQHLPSLPKAAKVVDLGCGNGVVGLIAATQNPEIEVTFVDESFMAVQSARENFALAFGTEHQGQFLATDCLQGLAKNHYDCILNNPPFHQQNAVGDFIAKQMFKESKRTLKLGGELYVIGNRHLGYHQTLKRIFGNCTTIASNRKFVILKSVKRA